MDPDRSVRPFFLPLIAAARRRAAQTAAHAADWTGKGEAGLVLANGNTDSKNGNAKLESRSTTENVETHLRPRGDLRAGRRRRPAKKRPPASAGRSTSSPTTTSARAVFWFGAGRYEDDRFSGFEYQATVSTGLGRHFIDNDRTKLTGTAGVGYKFFETRDTYDVTGPVPVLLQQGESRKRSACSAARST